jgi:hypothetical protein
MLDGARLAARLWLPRAVHERPAPAVLEYIPYRKNDFTAWRDSGMHGWFAGHGYACVRVDLRGSGDSDGVLRDEYLEQELADGEAVLAWIAAQPWCSGRVGMIGISWGGFNALQLAARQPPALHAVVTVCSTDDRYADDVHYMGGCLLGDNLSWASTMFAYNTCPPDPHTFGERWREAWFERLEHSGLWLATWLEHQHRDAYWKHGSICEDFAAVRVPVLAASGWADGYSNAVFRLLEHLDVPRMGLVGPWGHKYPHLGVPGPAIGFLQECLRWWDTWLAGRERGLADEPRLKAWMQDPMPPYTSYEERPGRWVAEECWPAPAIQPRRWAMTAGYGLLPEDAPARRGGRELTVQSPLSVGLFAGKWCSYAGAPDLPGDQREEDGGCLVFESAKLAAPMEILGAPVVELVLRSDRPVAMVAVRLSEVAPNRDTTRVCYGLLNLTHRESHEHPRPLEPGRRYRVRVALNHIAHRFAAGYCFRVALSTSYFPLAWAPPEPVRLLVSTGESHLELPVRPPRPDERRVALCAPPEHACPIERRVLETGEHAWRVYRDLDVDRSTLEVVKDEGVVRHEDSALEVERRKRERYSHERGRFTSLCGETEGVRGFRRGDWHVRTVTRTLFRSDASEFHVHGDLDAYESGRRVFSKIWDRRIPRRLL